MDASQKQQLTPIQQTAQAPQQQVPVTQQVPSGIGSSPHKEAGPVNVVPAPVVEAPVASYVQPTEKAPVIPTEVAKFGVEHAPNHEQHPLPQQMQQAGVSHAGQNQPVVVQENPSPQLPMAEEKAVGIAKEKKWHESVTWLAVFILRQFKLLKKEKKEVK